MKRTNCKRDNLKTTNLKHDKSEKEKTERGQIRTGTNWKLTSSEKVDLKKTTQFWKGNNRNWTTLKKKSCDTSGEETLNNHNSEKDTSEKNNPEKDTTENMTNMKGKI